VRMRMKVSRRGVEAQRAKWISPPKRQNDCLEMVALIPARATGWIGFMDLIDLWWNSSQQAAINELRMRLTSAGARTSTTIARQAELIHLMQQESDDLRVRIGVLIRLLIQHGVISADEYAAAVNDAKAGIAFAEKRELKSSAAVPSPKRPKPNLPKPK
jgi:hypothetical protein